MIYETGTASINAFSITITTYWIGNLNNGVEQFFYCTFIMILIHLVMDNFIVFLANYTSQSDSVFAIGGK